jgi:outer membrane receptor for ferrienterochelin and colicins
MKSVNLYFTIIYIFYSSIVLAQNTEVIGRLINENGSPVKGANVYIQGTVLGSATGNEGNFVIKNIPEGEYILSINIIGFESDDIPFKLFSGQILDLGIIVLNEKPLQLQPFVVTASKYEQDVQDVPASINTVTEDDLTYRNSITVKDALQYVSGINMNADQVNIRGSNGYSRGVGSRVIMLVDGLPYIAGDTQGIIFEAMSINQIDRIEIVKGAGSALYGSSAIGGVINIITKPISESPQLHLQLYGGIYPEPYYSEWQWSDETRWLNGMKFDYSRKFNNIGARFAVARDEDDSYRKNDWKKRYNFSGKVEYSLSAHDQISISGNYMDQKRGNFLYWKGLENALEPPDDQIGETIHSKRFYLSSSYRKVIKNDKFYKLNAIWFHNNFEDNIGPEGHNSDSDFIHAEFQYTTKISNHLLTLGFSPTFNKVSSDIFGSHKGIGLATYIQGESDWSEKWLSTLGARFDYYDMDKLGSDYQLNPKIGLVYKPYKGTSIRASTGSGFRAPSMAEAFTSTEAGGLPVRPNENLNAEKSISVEIGWNQVISEFIISDISVFYNRFWDLIEGGFYKFEDMDYIRFENVTNAQITGLECTLNAWLIKNRLLSNVGYTYTDPQNLTSGYYLNYRPRHLFYTGMQGFLFNFCAGMDYRYISRYDRIDEDFGRFINDYEERVSAYIVDVRLSTETKLANIPLKMSFQINNLFQYHYVDLIGSIAPIRNFVLTLETTF